MSEFNTYELLDVFKRNQTKIGLLSCLKDWVFRKQEEDSILTFPSVAGFCNSLSCRTVRFVKRGNEVYRSVPTSP